MKNLLKSKLKKFNSKKGLTLIELIVAITIMMIVISASVHGINISYRSALLGAAKNDAQSLAQRNCDIIMSAIVTNAERGTFDSTNVNSLGGMVTSDTSFSASKNTQIVNDVKFKLPNNSGYNYNQYDDIKWFDIATQTVDGARAAELDSTKKYQYYTIERRIRKIKNKEHQVYHIVTYVYYTDTAYVTCEGEVTVMPLATT